MVLTHKRMRSATDGGSTKTRITWDRLAGRLQDHRDHGRPWDCSPRKSLEFVPVTIAYAGLLSEVHFCLWFVDSYP